MTLINAAHRKVNLSFRESQCARMMCERLMTQVEIAKEIGLAVTTVRHYMERVYDKLDVNDRFKMAMLLLARGVIKNPYSNEPNG